MEAKGHEEEVAAWYRHTSLHRPCFRVVDRVCRTIADRAVSHVLHDHARLRTTDGETHLLTHTLDGLMSRSVRAEGEGRCRWWRAGRSVSDDGGIAGRRRRWNTLRGVTLHAEGRHWWGRGR